MVGLPRGESAMQMSADVAVSPCVNPEVYVLWAARGAICLCDFQ